MQPAVSTVPAQRKRPPGVAAKVEVRPRARERNVELPAAGSVRAASPSELRLVQTLMAETESLRGLQFRGQVRVTIEDRAAMRAYVQRAIDAEQLDRATRRYVALGAIEPSLDIRALLVAVMEEELIGYYDPLEKRLAVRDDIARALGSESSHDERGLTWRATVVHELVHALQDQYFALGERIEQTRSTDADNAFGALVEGDATLVMLAYTAQQAGVSLATLAAQPERILSAMTRSPDQLTGALRRAPALLREPLLFRYRDGAHFCAALFHRGGWAAVDRAQLSPPQATATIRHGERFVAGQPEPSLAAPDLQSLQALGYRAIDEDTLGALELAVLLDAAPIDAQRIVDAWRGDRYAVVERGGALGTVWWLRFATPSAARSIALALQGLGDPQRKSTQRGAFVLVTRGLERAATAALAPWFQRASAGHASPLPGVEAPHAAARFR